MSKKQSNPNPPCKVKPPMFDDANVIWKCPICNKENRWHWEECDIPKDGGIITMACDFCWANSRMAKFQNGYAWMGTSVEKSMLKDSGERTIFDTGAQRDIQTGKGRFDLLPDAALMELAKHFEQGALKYNDRNWEKGIPISRFIDSASRHLVKFKMGLTDEPHLVAALWNLICAQETLIRIKENILPKELDDLPYPFKDKEAPQV